MAAIQSYPAAQNQPFPGGPSHPASLYVDDDSDAASARQSRIVSQPAPLLDQCELHI